MPPLQALAALHGLWFMILLPPVVWARRLRSRHRLQLLGLAFITLGLVGLALVVWHTLMVWVAEAPEDRREYIWQRILFLVVTLSDVPMIQSMAAGLTCLIAARRRSDPADSSPSLTPL